VLAALLDELSAYPCTQAVDAHEPPGVVEPFQLDTPGGRLSFISTTTIFGTPVDVTLSELAIESFFPADAATSKALRQPAEADAAR
jgi:MmyB-like transcription regulator ligand binding domain